jgi:sugar lactone lactonase YvrE
MITPAGVVSTIAGNGTSGFADGAAASAEFKDPPSVAVDPNNNILVGDPFNYKIREVSTAGTVSTVAGTTVGETDGSTTTAQFDSPTWMAEDANGNIFVLDAHYIRKISGGSVSTIFDGKNYSSTLNSFTGITLKPNDTLILLDDFGANVFQLTPSGTFTSIAGTGSAGYYDAPAATAQFSSATGVDMDAKGNILVADEANLRIRLITPGGMVTTIAGSGTAGSADGVGTAAQFNDPHGIAVDKKSGTIYVLEPMNNRIRKITVE